jgi:hypothetical protein
MPRSASPDSASSAARRCRCLTSSAPAPATRARRFVPATGRRRVGAKLTSACVRRCRAVMTVVELRAIALRLLPHRAASGQRVARVLAQCSGSVGGCTGGGVTAGSGTWGTEVGTGADGTSDGAMLGTGTGAETVGRSGAWTVGTGAGFEPEPELPPLPPLLVEPPLPLEPPLPRPSEPDPAPPEPLPAEPDPAPPAGPELPPGRAPACGSPPRAPECDPARGEGEAPCRMAGRSRWRRVARPAWGAFPSPDRRRCSGGWGLGADASAPPPLL